MTRGVRQIVRFNWPFYAAAAGVIVAVALIAGRLPLNPAFRLAAYASIGLSAVWIAGSLVASWIVYDRSPLMRFDWLDRAVGFHPDSWINIHAGLDGSTMALRALFGPASWRVFDIFDPVEMTEPSIGRARRLADNDVPAEIVDFRRLPAPNGAVDLVLLMLSAHELRTDETRGALFSELRRIVAPGSRSIRSFRSRRSSASSCSGG